jgi:probable rRNA maturation factor
MTEEHPDLHIEQIGVVCLDDAQMTAVNREYFAKNRPTDVISFRYDPLPGADGAEGEVLVNVERAVQVGGRYQGRSAELALYLAHGMNHLSGADDATPAERAAMRRTERRRLKKAAEAHLTENLITEEL